MAKRPYYQRGSWGLCELLPRIRLCVSHGNVGLGFGWLIWWVHIWVWNAPETPAPPPAPVGKRWYVCNEYDCAWAGTLEETVHPKHDTETALCPECHETTTWFEPHAFIACNPNYAPGLYEAGVCHECGLPDLHEIHALSRDGRT